MLSWRFPVMIESKVITLFNCNVIEERDMLDVFLYEDKLAPDSAARVSKKLRIGSLNASAVSGRLKSIMSARDYHIRNITQIIDDQLDPQAADRIRNGGGAHMVFDHVLEILQDKLKLPRGDEP